MMMLWMEERVFGFEMLDVWGGGCRNRDCLPGQGVSGEDTTVQDGVGCTLYD